MSLSRSLLVTQISRDAGHMYVRYVDLTQAANQVIIVRLASGMGLPPSRREPAATLTAMVPNGETSIGRLSEGESTCPL